MTFQSGDFVESFVQQLQEQLDYTFQDSKLLEMALTHASHVAEKSTQLADNQRLEFLGDAVLQLVLTEELYKRFPEHAEGVLTKWRARLVSRYALAEFSAQLELGKFMLMGKGEAASGGRARPSTLADCLEAVLGAVYLDGGYEASQKVILKLTENSIDGIAHKPGEGNPKGELQEILQAIVPESPVYEIVSEEGPDHEKQFVSAVTWQGIVLGKGKGASKKLAEADAAKQALTQELWGSNAS